jgi:predicted enzyme related to lactoylglutathione lyase
MLSDNARESTTRTTAMNAIDWFAIPVVELERARRFYCAMLGLESMENMETPNGTCALFPCAEGGVGGSLNPFMGFKPTDDSGVTVWLNAGEDLQVALDRVPSAGGKVLQEKTPISDEYGFMAMVLDTEGNRIGLHSMK